MRLTAIIILEVSAEDAEDAEDATREIMLGLRHSQRDLVRYGVGGSLVLPMDVGAVAAALRGEAPGG